MKRAGLSVEADDLLNLREKILALVPRSKAARIETDHEALLEAQGLAARPGPRQRIDRKIIVAIAEAIKACRMLEVEYRSRDETAPRRRRLAPYGLLTGLRRYLVARPDDDPVRHPCVSTWWRTSARPRSPRSLSCATLAFDLQAFADRAFGVFQNEDEFGEVVWRFTPKAAAHARGFEFHPGQVFEEEPDGSLIVRFSAAGHLEMSWHLYVWGDQVDVLAPERLRQMIKGHRRADFPSLP